MRIAIALALLVLAVLAATLTHPRAGLPPASAETAATSSCSIAGAPQGKLPQLTPSPIAELLPEQMPRLEKAYFSMGCFWGSEAMLASCPGVMFTRVGFTGGTLPDPSYSAIGDHVETVEVLFDPEQVSYRSLLDHFWSHHNAHAKPIFRQYASAIFCSTAQQEQTAKETREKREASTSGQPLLTAIMPLEKFYPADPGHQKYYLSQDPELLRQLPRFGHQRVETRLATKLNALVGRSGRREDLKVALAELGLSDETSEALLIRAGWTDDHP